MGKAKVVKVRTKPKPLGRRDVMGVVSDDPAYMALIDIRSYEKDLPDWDYGSLTRKLAAAGNAGQVVAWGCPEQSLRVRLTTRPLTGAVATRGHASFTARLVVTGPLCLAGYTSLTMCAQFEDYAFPQSGDLVVSIAPGEYRLDVHRLFAHRRGDQFSDGDLPAGDHYIVVFNAGERVRASRRKDVPWAPKP